MPGPGQEKQPLEDAYVLRSVKDLIIIVVLAAASILLTAVLLAKLHVPEGVFSSKDAAFIPPENGTWRFIVSGDSRNCGDVVLPTIAADSLPRYQPAFYWHLGDLRAIYKIDEDMAAEAEKKGEALSCKSYLDRAWPDFIQHQIAPFGRTRFYVGIGNHEVIPPKTVSEFSSTFEDWLITPRRQMERAEQQEIATAKEGPCRKIAAKPYLAALPYYHWIQDGVDFIYLDNSSGVFSRDQLDWFDCTLARAENNGEIRAVVVGMHEALPHSMASNHAMCDNATPDPKKKEESCKSGEYVYNALLALQKKKHVYVLASHSHFFLKGIYDQKPQAERLPGWIVGTGGAFRYALPDGIHPGPSAREDVYGYLLATVHQDGQIDFNFKEVKESDVPAEVRKRYPGGFPKWCFSQNSEHMGVSSMENTNRCGPTLPAAPASSATPAGEKK